MRQQACSASCQLALRPSLQELLNRRKGDVFVVVFRDDVSAAFQNDLLFVGGGDTRPDKVQGVE